jgi:uncharacterized membrane protein
VRGLPRPGASRSRLGAGLLVALGAIALLTVVGLVDLWPRGESIATDAAGTPLATERARVVAVREGGCRVAAVPDPGEAAGAGCRRVTVALESGPDEGEEVAFDVAGVPVDVGARVRVADSGIPPGAEVGGVAVDRYAFSDFERRAPLLWLTVAFALLVLTARWRGVRALAGLAASLAVVVLFVVPAILEGSSPLAVATVGALAIMLLTIPLAHGLGPKSVAACLGTAAALVITLLLARFATDVAHITGFSSEEATFLRASAQELSIQGLLLAGIVIGALGVLDDLTVTQASTVMALRRANPGLGGPRLFREALTVGNDHIVAVVNTLVLAYVGASLPVLLVFSVADTSISDAVNSEVVASEIVATLVGSIGLIAAVPITTALAALLAVRTPPDALEAEGHSHAH